ncbi:MAG: SUMF1/EgtB/PvdO family nonheme iron enzyme [Archangium sp.]
MCTRTTRWCVWLTAVLASGAWAQSDGGLTWRHVPAGTFVFGCSDELDGGFTSVGAAAKSTTQRMPALSMTPQRISVGEYRGCVDAGVCSPAAGVNCDTLEDALPITCVDFEQSAKFCAWAGGRLPTDVEWEYFADVGSELIGFVDDKHGATEWVQKAANWPRGYEGTRGGQEDLVPQPRCSRGAAMRDAHTNRIGFRCVREGSVTTVAPFPKVVAPAPRVIRNFVSEDRRVLLRERLSDEQSKKTFAVCASEVVALGKFLEQTNRQLGGAESGGPHAVPHFAYAVSCAPVFIIEANDMRPGAFRALAAEVPSAPIRHVAPRPKWGDARFDARTCTVASKTKSLALGPAPNCSLQFAGDLNDDGIADVMVQHDADICRAWTLALSSSSGWTKFASDVVWCPD